MKPPFWNAERQPFVLALAAVVQIQTSFPQARRIRQPSKRNEGQDFGNSPFPSFPPSTDCFSLGTLSSTGNPKLFFAVAGCDARQLVDSLQDARKNEKCSFVAGPDWHSFRYLFQAFVRQQENLADCRDKLCFNQSKAITFFEKSNQPQHQLSKTKFI